MVEEAQNLIKQGKGSSSLNHIDFLYCQDTTVSASTFVSYYGPDPRLDTAYLIPKIKQPTLVVIAGSDEIVINDRKFAPLANANRVQVKVIEGAGHFFRDLNADDAVDAISGFLKGLDSY